MNNKFRAVTALAICLILVLGCCLSCASRYDKNLIGSWVIIEYVTEDGMSATIENELYLTFYEGGHGETKSSSDTYNTFTYSTQRGSMMRVIDYGRGEPETVEETYAFNDDGTLTIKTPETKNAPAATMTLRRRGT